MQQRVFTVRIVALEPIGTREALGPFRTMSPLDEHMVFAGRRAFAIGAAHKAEGSILPDDAHDGLLVQGVDALPLKENGRSKCRSALDPDLPGDRV
jgi:hypothetical protein